MDLAVIIVGIDKWAEFTLPAVASIRQHEPDARIVVVDAGSKTPYPVLEDEGITSLRLDPSPSYAYAINQGVKAAGKADWYLLLNNDVFLHSPITPIIETLDPSFIYGRQIITEAGHTWLGLWLALIPWWVWYLVGEFDERFLLCGFEDADYCVRAHELGIATIAVDLAFHHYWGKTRWGLPGYNAVRAENMDYFQAKHGYRLGDNVQVIHD
jgi:GT2 family glycosyltransferase